MLTRKHFTAVAAIIKAAKNEGDPAHAIVRDLADLFEKENELFDRAKFYKAAGYEHYHAPKPESETDSLTNFEHLCEAVAVLDKPFDEVAKDELADTALTLFWLLTGVSFGTFANYRPEDQDDLLNETVDKIGT